MKLTKKSDKSEKSDGAEHPHGGPHHHMPWDAAMAGLASGAYDAAGYPREDRADVDMPLAQSPAPGVDPVGGTETAAPGDVLTNVVPASGIALAAPRPAPAQAAPEPPVPAETKVSAKVDTKGDVKA